MTADRKTFESSLARLATILEALRGTVQGLVETLDRQQRIPLIIAGAEAHAAIVRVKHEILDLDPEFGDASDLAVEEQLTPLVDLLDRDDPVMRPNLLRQILDYAPASLVEAAERAASDAERCALIREWWSAEPRPFRPIDRLDRLLDSDRRWKRFLAARMLANLGEPSLIDPSATDLDPEAVARWRATRRREPPE